MATGVLCRLFRSEVSVAPRSPVALAVPRVTTNETVAAIAMLGAFIGPSSLGAAFPVFAVGVARPQWAPPRALILVLLMRLLGCAQRTSTPRLIRP